MSTIFNEYGATVSHCELTNIECYIDKILESVKELNPTPLETRALEPLMKANKKLEGLLNEAKESMLFREHKINKINIYKVAGGQEATITCKDCNKGAWVETSPAPNGIEISGEAVALSCK